MFTTVKQDIFIIIGANFHISSPMANCSKPTDYVCKVKVHAKFSTLKFILAYNTLNMRNVDLYHYENFPLYSTAYSRNDITLPSQKRAHGWCTSHWAKIAGWADILGISIAFILERASK